MNSSVFPGFCNRKDQRFLVDGEESLTKVGDFEHWVNQILLEGGNSFMAAAWVFTGKQSVVALTRDSGVD